MFDQTALESDVRELDTLIHTFISPMTLIVHGNHWPYLCLWIFVIILIFRRCRTYVVVLPWLVWFTSLRRAKRPWLLQRCYLFWRRGTVVRLSWGLKQGSPLLLLFFKLLLYRYILLSIKHLIDQLRMVVEQGEALVRAVKDLRDVLVYLIPH